MLWLGVRDATCNVTGFDHACADTVLLAASLAAGMCAGLTQVTDFWGKLWLGAGNATGDAVRAALAHVRQMPHWNCTNGADHIMVFSYDRGAQPQPASCTTYGLRRHGRPTGAGSLSDVRVQ